MVATAARREGPGGVFDVARVTPERADRCRAMGSVFDEQGFVTYYDGRV